MGGRTLVQNSPLRQSRPLHQLNHLHQLSLQRQLRPAYQNYRQTRGQLAKQPRRLNRRYLRRPNRFSLGL